MKEGKLGPKGFEGATIMECNGQRFDEFNEDKLIDTLKVPGRSKDILFRHANDEDAERMWSFFWVK